MPSCLPPCVEGNRFVMKLDMLGNWVSCCLTSARGNVPEEGMKVGEPPSCEETHG